MRGPLFFLLAAASLFACASLWAQQAPAARPQQVLVMLRAAPHHFQPATAYGGGAYRTAGDEVAGRRIANQLAREHGLELVDDWPMPALGVNCFVMRVVNGDSPSAMAAVLAHDARVESAEPMQWFHVLGASQGDPLFALQPVAKRWHLSQLHALATGRGITIAEIDSGVAVNHPDLVGQVELVHNFVDDHAYQGEKHGTEVAGILVAREGNGVGIAGVAPEARLLALRACWEDTDDSGAICSTFTLAKALQFALDNRAKVVNMSLSGPDDRLLERLLDVALSSHVSVVAAIDEHSADGGFPAAYPGVLAVARDNGSPAPSHALRAPGDDVPAPHPDGGWDFVSGSSFATAEVSGLVALMRELSPSITAAHLRDAMAAKSAIGLAAQRPAVIDACAAVAQAGGHCACDCTAASLSSSAPRR